MIFGGLRKILFLCIPFLGINLLSIFYVTHLSINRKESDWWK